MVEADIPSLPDVIYDPRSSGAPGTGGVLITTRQNI